MFHWVILVSFSQLHQTLGHLMGLNGEVQSASLMMSSKWDGRSEPTPSSLEQWRPWREAEREERKRRLFQIIATLSPIPHTGIKIPCEVGSGLPWPVHYWICHMPHTTSKQINQNSDTLTQEDSDVVIHQNSNQKNKSIPRHCTILMLLGS